MTCATRFMTPTEVLAVRPAPPPPPGTDRLALARARMAEAGSWHPRQPIGRRFPIGCVALEITQRCNLDCTLCYLSEHAEAVQDVPIEEVFRRIRLIHDHYGPDTEVQVTGGDPTLRRRDELVAIVRAVAASGMRASLFTNGIRATRDLLAELAAAGLTDVAFHVDMTQGRRGHDSEASLHAVREEYIARARGLGLAIVFNTTVFDGNAHEVPDLARFFLRHAAEVNLASFQLQAETGRGVLGARQAPITKDSIAAALAEGAGAPLTFDTVAVGHAGCNRYALMLVANGRAHDLLDDQAVAARVLEAIRDTRIDRTRPWRRAAAILGAMATHPRAALASLPWAARKAWGMRRDLLAGGAPAKLTFFLHDFMDARRLEPERIAACSFMAMTAEGPMAMCLHNARRDEILLRPVAVEGGGWWDPLTGRRSAEPAAPRTPPAAGRRTAKGRRRLEIRHGIAHPR